MRSMKLSIAMMMVIVLFGAQQAHAQCAMLNTSAPHEMSGSFIDHGMDHIAPMNSMDHGKVPCPNCDHILPTLGTCDEQISMAAHSSLSIQKPVFVDFIILKAAPVPQPSDIQAGPIYSGPQTLCPATTLVQQGIQLLI